MGCKSTTTRHSDNAAPPQPLPNGRESVRFKTPDGDAVSQQQQQPPPEQTQPRSQGPPRPFMPDMAPGGDLSRVSFATTTKLLGRGGTASVFVGVATRALPKPTQPDQAAAVAPPSLSPADVLGIVAVKEVVVSDEGKLAGLRREHEALRALDCDRIVRVFAFDEQHSGSNRARIYMELVPKGTLTAHTKRLPARRLHEFAARAYFRECLVGLGYLHSRGILHRDVKPLNMLLAQPFTFDAAPNDTNAASAAASSSPLSPTCANTGLGGALVKLTDFGECKATVAGAVCATTANVVGTVPYMSPECIRGKFSFASDVWALAVSFIELMTDPQKAPEDASDATAAPWREATTAPPPFWSHLRARDSFGLLMAIGVLTDGKHLPLMPPHMSPSLRALLARCLAFDPSARPTAEALLADPYFDRTAEPSGMEPLESYRRVGAAER